MKMTDGKRTIEIRMMVWNGSGWGPDWSNDFFDAGLLPYDDETETHTVQDVGYCIEAAEEWAAEDDDNCVSVDDI